MRRRARPWAPRRRAGRGYGRPRRGPASRRARARRLTAGASWPRANGWAGLGAARAVPCVVAKPADDGLELPAVDRWRLTPASPPGSRAHHRVARRVGCGRPPRAREVASRRRRSSSSSSAADALDAIGRADRVGAGDRADRRRRGDGGGCVATRRRARVGCAAATARDRAAPATARGRAVRWAADVPAGAATVWRRPAVRRVGGRAAGARRSGRCSRWASVPEIVDRLTGPAPTRRQGRAEAGPARQRLARGRAGPRRRRDASTRPPRCRGTLGLATHRRGCGRPQTERGACRSDEAVAGAQVVARPRPRQRLPRLAGRATGRAAVAAVVSGRSGVRIGDPGDRGHASGSAAGFERRDRGRAVACPDGIDHLRLGERTPMRPPEPSASRRGLRGAGPVPGSPRTRRTRPAGRAPRRARAWRASSPRARAAGRSAAGPASPGSAPAKVPGAATSGIGPAVRWIGGRLAHARDGAAAGAARRLRIPCPSRRSMPRPRSSSGARDRTAGARRLSPPRRSGG